MAVQLSYLLNFLQTEGVKCTSTQEQTVVCQVGYPALKKDQMVSSRKLFFFNFFFTCSCLLKFVSFLPRWNFRSISITTSIIRWIGQRSSLRLKGEHPAIMPSKNMARFLFVYGSMFLCCVLCCFAVTVKSRFPQTTKWMCPFLFNTMQELFYPGDLLLLFFFLITVIPGL